MGRMLELRNLHRCCSEEIVQIRIATIRVAVPVMIVVVRRRVLIVEIALTRTARENDAFSIASFSPVCTAAYVALVTVLLRCFVVALAVG